MFLERGTVCTFVLPTNPSQSSDLGIRTPAEEKYDRRSRLFMRLD